MRYLPCQNRPKSRFTSPKTRSVDRPSNHHRRKVFMSDHSPVPDEIALLQQIDSRERLKAAERAAFFEIMGTVVEALPDALIITDEAGEIILANAQAELIFGYHRDQMIGHPVEMLLPERFQQNHASLRAGYVAEPRL